MERVNRSIHTTIDTIMSCTRLLAGYMTKDNLKYVGKRAILVCGVYYSLKAVCLCVYGVMRYAMVYRDSTVTSRRSLADVFGPNRGDWAVVTGATSGIGLEFVKILNLCNMNVLMVGRDEQKLRELAESMYSDLRRTAVVYVVLDYRDTSVKEIFEALDRSMEDNGIKDIKLLVNNVGSTSLGRFEAQSHEEMIEDLSVNIRSHLAMTFYFQNKIKRSRPRDHSGMIFIGSMLGDIDTPALKTYPFAKSILHLIGDYISRSHGQYFDTLVAPIGNVLTNSNNPMRDKERDYTKVDLKKAGGSYVSAHDCAMAILLNFGIKRVTAGHPMHERQRVYLPYFAFLYRMKMSSLLKGKGGRGV